MPKVGRILETNFTVYVGTGRSFNFAYCRPLINIRNYRAVLKRSGDALGHSGTLGDALRRSGTLWEALETLWGRSGTLWGRSGDALGNLLREFVALHYERHPKSVRGCLGSSCRR